MTDLDLARRWIEAVNARDAERLEAMAHEDVEVVTPQGTQRGHAPLAQFVQRQSYGVAMHVGPERWFGAEGRIVVDGISEFRDVETGEVAGSERSAAFFDIRAGRVARLEVHRQLEPALAAAGLTEDDLL